MDFPLGAISWAHATLRGSVAVATPPARNPVQKTQFPGRMSRRYRMGGVTAWHSMKTRLYPNLSDRCPARSPPIAPATVKSETIVPIETRE